MGFPLWGLLNIAAYLFFIFICFKASKFIREQIGLFPVLIFWVGILSFIIQSKSDNGEQNANILMPKNIAIEDKNIQDFNKIEIILLQDRLTKFTLDIDYNRDKETKIIKLIHAYSKAYMFPNGNNWKPKAVYLGMAEKTDKFTYYVTGDIEWKLLGLTIFTTFKSFNGSALIK